MRSATGRQRINLHLVPELERMKPVLTKDKQDDAEPSLRKSRNLAWASSDSGKIHVHLDDACRHHAKVPHLLPRPR